MSSNLNELKNTLKLALASDNRLCIKKLREAINTGSPKMNELTIAEGRLNDTERQFNQGLIGHDTLSTEKNRINQVLLSIIDRLTVEDTLFRNKKISITSKPIIKQIACDKCKGEGYTYKSVETMFGNFKKKVNCNNCNKDG